MIGHMIYFTSPTNPQRDRKINRSGPEDIVRFKPNGEPGRWPSRHGK